MSGRRRHSKWDHKDSEALTEDSHDKAQTRRPREPLSPSRGSRRHDSRSKEKMMTWDKEGNNGRISPSLEDYRQHQSRSPRNGWGRLYRSRSRSRSRSPAHHLRREPTVTDRSRSRSGVPAQICRDFVAGRCRKGSSCHFVHQDAQPYDGRQPLDCSPSDDWESRHRRVGGSRYSPVDTKDYALRTEKSMHICSDFLKGRCRRGDSCRYEHRDPPPDAFQEDLIDNVHRDRDIVHRSRDTYSHRLNDREPADVFEKGPVDDIQRDNSYRSRDTFSHRNHDHEPADMFEKGPVDEFHRDNAHRSRDTFSHRNHDPPADMFEKGPVDEFHRDKDRDRDNAHRSRDTFSHRSHDRAPANVFEKRPADDVHRDRENLYKSRDTYSHRNHDREPADVLEKGPLDDAFKVRDNDHRIKDAYRNHDREPHKRGEALCKFFASGNCRNGSRCRFIHEVRERLSPEKRSKDDKWGPDQKVESGQVWDGPGWSDMAAVPNIAPGKGWGDDKSEVIEVAKQVNAARSGDDSWSHDMVNIKQTWVTPVANDEFLVQDGKPPVQWDTKPSVPGMGLPAGAQNNSGDLKISPGDMRPYGLSSSNSLAPSVSNNSFGTIRPDVISEASYEKPYPIGLQDQNAYIDPFPMQNSNHKKENPDVYHGEGRNAMGDNDGLCIPGPAINVPPQQGLFQIDQVVSAQPSSGTIHTPAHIPSTAMNFHPQQGFFQTDQILIAQPGSGINPAAAQGQAQFPSDPSEGDRMRLSHNPATFLNNIAGGAPHVVNATSSGLVSATAASLSTVSNEQLVQLSNLSASLAQLLENRQQLPQLGSAIAAPAVTNHPVSVASVPAVFGSTIQTNQAPETLEQQHHPVCSSVEPKLQDVADPRLACDLEQKSANKVLDDEGGNMKQQEPVAVPKDDDNVRKAAEGSSKAPENKPSEDVPVEDADDGNKSKDSKAIRPFKFALAEFVKELLKPSWKDGQVDKDSYKIIVKKVVDKIIETQGLQIPQTKEKIDQYLSSSKPKIGKLVQAYVGKFQKNGS